jgi:two-component system, NtrC family, response regulator
LDEVGELPLSIQKRFLRVLQERSFRPVGAKALETSNFRLIAATNRDLDRSVEKGEFRADLLFRLRSLTITLPPLRERREDIKALALHHIDKLCKRYETEPKGIASDFFDALRGYDWPGNVRELNQALEKALIAAGPEPMLFAKDLPVEIRIMAAQKSLSSSPSSADGQTGALSLSLPDPLPPLKVYRDSVLDEAEKQYLTALLGRTRGNVREARRTADLSRSRFYTLLKKHNIDVSEHRVPKGRS